MDTLPAKPLSTHSRGFVGGESTDSPPVDRRTRARGHIHLTNTVYHPQNFIPLVWVFYTNVNSVSVVLISNLLEPLSDLSAPYRLYVEALINAVRPDKGFRGWLSGVSTAVGNQSALLERSRRCGAGAVVVARVGSCRVFAAATVATWWGAWLM